MPIVPSLNQRLFSRDLQTNASARGLIAPARALTALLIAFALAMPHTLAAQNGQGSSSSSSSGTAGAPESHPGEVTGPQAGRVAQPEFGGSAITLETNEPLFDLAVALNACGYDADLADSSPVRQEIRDEVNKQLETSDSARNSRDALCVYIRQHALNDPGRSLAQYVSLALYLKPPPELTPTVDETELPPESTQVLSILPLLRTFSEEIRLHAIWVEHRPQYERLVAFVHVPLTAMVLNTNIYLHLPVSSYEGRRFLVLLEPMLSPKATNARYDASESIVIVSPAKEPAGKVPMDLIRHTYLHYTVEPLVYARAAAMDRLLPLLKPVQSAPLDFTYKSDIVALLTECLIKAIEARTMDVGILKPTRPTVVHDRADIERYDADLTLYDRKAEAVRRQNVEREMRQGWVLVDYFYDQLGTMEKESISLKDNIGPMVYGMDVDHERHHDEQIQFLAESSGSDVVRRTPRQLTGLDLAEMKLLKGDKTGAEEIADTALADPNGNHAEAHFLLARIDLMDGAPEDAETHFNEAVKMSRDPRTLAWSHIYLGRLYDVKPDRPRALTEYRTALTVRDDRPDTKAAAEQGLKAPFALPKRTAASSDQEDDNAPLDPSGKAEKESYRPTPPQ